MGYDRPGALALIGENQVLLVRDQATRLSETIERLANLRAQQNQRGPFTRVVAFATGYDRELAARTGRDFDFALPLSIDAILFTCMGFIVSLLLLWVAVVGLGRLAKA